VAMAVKLILVTLVVVVAVCSTGSLAQQSQGTGGSSLPDRRTQLLKRFQSRRKAENSLKKTRKGSASEEDLARRRLLFQRNPLRGRKPSSSGSNAITSSRQKNSRVTPARIRPTTTRAPTNPPAPAFPPSNAIVDLEPTVVRISNSDRDIQNLVLQKPDNKDKKQKPFTGVSEVKTLSEPSGFRSLNEQIVRISFKQTTTSKPVVQEEEEINQRQIPSRRKLFRPRPKGLGFPRRNTLNKPEKEEERVLEPSDALQALLQTASESDLTEESKEVKEEKPEKKFPIEMEAAIREMKEDSQPLRGRSDSPRKLNALLNRVNKIRSNLRGRTGQRRKVPNIATRTNEEESPRAKTNFRSFPARQSAGRNPSRGRGSLPLRPASRTEQLVPTQAPEILRQNTEIFTAAPFTLPPVAETTFTPTQAITIELTEEEIFPEGRDKFFADNGIFPTLQDAELEAERRNKEVLRTLQNQFANEAPRTQQTFQSNTGANQFQPAVRNQIQQGAPVPFQSRPQVPARLNTPSAGQAAQNPFGLLNTNNFQAFDSQFGGAVPSSPGAAKLNSNIFTRPQTQQQFQPQQSRFQPQPQQFQPQPQQFQPQQQQFQPQPQQFQPQTTQTQPQQSVFSNPNVPSSRFTGHPASNIDLSTGSFSLQTGK